VIIDNVNDYTCIFPVLAREMELAAVYHRMPVREIVDVTVKNDALTDAFRIFQIITSFNIVADIVPNNYIIRVA
jgi:hypothetical protein